MNSSMQSLEGRPISGPSPLFCRKCGGGDFKVYEQEKYLLAQVIECRACGWLWWLAP